MANGSAATGIIQNVGSGGHTYSVTAGHENFPVNFVTWGDSCAVCQLAAERSTFRAGRTGDHRNWNVCSEWRDHGCGVDAHHAATPVRLGFSPLKTSGIRLPTTRGDGFNSGYWLYPTRSDIVPSNTLSATGTNNANYHNGVDFTDPTNFLTTVGAFAASPGPYGTFDQGGDVHQWNETAVVPGLYFGLRWRGVQRHHTEHDLDYARGQQSDI